MREALLLVTEGANHLQVKQACEALSLPFEVRSPSDTSKCTQGVWLLDLPIEQAVVVARSRPSGTTSLALLNADEADAGWTSLHDDIDDIVFAPLRHEELVGRIKAAMRRATLDALDRARTLRLVAHDINNPLTAIRLLSEMLATDQEDPNDKRDLEDILEASDLAATIVESLSGLARMESLPARSPAMPVDLRALMQEATSRPCMRSHARVEIPTYPVMVRAEEPQLKQAIFDMVLNARSLTEGRTAFWVSCRLEGEDAVFRARAPGKQIPADMVDGLLAPYGVVALRDSRVHVAATGLAYASKTARRLGGTLRVYSDDRGTSFELRLPVLTNH